MAECNKIVILRWPLLVFFATSGVVGVVYGFISPEWPLTQLSVGLTGRMMVSGAYYICLQYGSEIFPTVIRGQVSSNSRDFKKNS